MFHLVGHASFDMNSSRQFISVIFSSRMDKDYHMMLEVSSQVSSGWACIQISATFSPDLNIKLAVFISYFGPPDLDTLEFAIYH